MRIPSAPVVALALVVGTLARAGAADPSLPPQKTPALFRWLAEGTYRATYTGEPAVHESATAHGMHVRTWYSPVLTEDLAAGRSRYRRGAAMVKELYFGGTETVLGWSVMRKVRSRSARGRGWFFFETFDGESVVARGRGVRVCVGCHTDGADFLLSPFRP
jgi:hypothetical protein